MFAELLEQSKKRCAVLLPWMIPPPLTRQWTAKELKKRKRAAQGTQVKETLNASPTVTSMSATATSGAINRLAYSAKRVSCETWLHTKTTYT